MAIHLTFGSAPEILTSSILPKFQLSVVQFPLPRLKPGAFEKETGNNIVFLLSVEGTLVVPPWT